MDSALFGLLENMQFNVFCLLIGLAAAVAEGETRAPRYVGRTADGKWIQGERLSDWHRTDGKPQLDGQPLFSRDAPIRWLLDERLPLAKPLDSFVETISGDRFPGTVVGFRRGDEIDFRQEPAHFVVRSEAELSLPPALRAPMVRVVSRHVQRIVWHRRPAGRLRPRTVFLRDGGQLEFRAARFESDSVTLLLENGTKQVAFSAIAELHLKSRDSWDGYRDELSMLSPDGESRILQISTVGGLVATSSMARFDARVRGDTEDSDRWLHGLQPAWSLDMIWVRNADIRMRRSFAAHEIPLTRIRPEPATRRGSANRSGWPWRRNENVLSGPLRFAGHTFGWGFGVHAPQELRFALPVSAVALETWVGLDAVVGRGGCARGRIVLEDARDRPLFESPLLVGSGTGAATGRVALPELELGPRKLVLIADAAHEPRPPGTDPWEIRDFLDWGDPVIQLHPHRFRQEVERSVVHQIAAFRGWHVHLDDTSLRGVNVMSNSPDMRGGFHYAVAIQGSALELTRRVTIEPDDRWLVVYAAATEPSGGAARLEVSIDNVRTAESPLPVIPATSVESEPLAFKLASSLRGQTHEIKLRLLPATNSLPVLWRGISISPQHPSIVCLLEDDSDVGRQVVSGDAFSGERCLRLAGGEQIALPLSFGPIAIRDVPALGQYRFARFAFRRQGPGTLRFELHRGDADDKPFIYSAGPDSRSEIGARSVWSGPLSDRWIVITRDVFRDFEACELRSITIRNSGTGTMLFDHLYFARHPSDFELPDQQ